MTNETLHESIGLLTGRVEAMGECQNQSFELLQGIDERLRKVEQKSAVHGALAGGAASLIVAICGDYFRKATGGG
ncbi:MAG: hypothetical protein HQL66_03200 [Magnetococcales bacterium]|nr:hypothetical protein [Magnetococcales bacterium]